MSAPLFHGRQVRLSAPQSEADFQAMADWSRDTEYLRLMDDEPAQPWSAKQLKQEFDEAIRHDSFVFVIRALEDDRPIGAVGLGSVSELHGDGWVGIGIGDRDFWGRGYGTDAMRVLLRFAFTELNLHRVTLGVFEYNTRAIRSYQKAGFVVEGRVRQELLRDGRRRDAIYMGVLREEWVRTAEEAV